MKPTESVMFALVMLALPASARSEQPALDPAIRQHRMGLIEVTTRPGAEVRVEQSRHEFWFGAALASQMFGENADPATAERYKQVFLDNFNAAVTENALKWHSMERERGQVHYETVDAILAWTDAHEIPLRGHNIFWGVPSMVQPWQKELSDSELREVLEARARDVATRYKGRFAEYDLNNEMLHANYYADRLGPTITRDMANWVRECDPQAVLFLNDYDILTGRRVDDYAAQVRDLRAQGVTLGGIGVQGHSHTDTFDPAALKNSLDILAEFKLPIRITEFNMPAQNSRQYRDRGGRLTDEEEQAKARAIVAYYTICFAHPAVDGILMWGFWEGANWIPASSLYRRDWTPTPAADAYQDLIHNQWWTRATVRADASGRCSIPAFYGTHRVRVGDNEVDVILKRAEGRAQVDLRSLIAPSGE